jgi:hypothetical protein
MTCISLVDFAGFGRGKLIEEGHPSPNRTFGEQLGMVHYSSWSKTAIIHLPPEAALECPGSHALVSAPQKRVVAQVSERVCQPKLIGVLSTHGFVREKYRCWPGSFPPHFVDHPLLLLASLLVGRGCDDGRRVGLVTKSNRRIVSDIRAFVAPISTAYLYTCEIPWRLNKGGGNNLRLLRVASWSCGGSDG